LSCSIWNYESEEALWTDTLAKNPNSWVGYNNLGLSFFRKGQLDRATAQYQKALEINPFYADALGNLGHALLEEGQLDRGFAQFQRAVEINPGYLEAHTSLGVASFKRGRWMTLLPNTKRPSESIQTMQKPTTTLLWL
jgi:tetratricopeptide (TPR) repeat protein